jgi:hypothetical protein
MKLHIWTDETSYLAVCHAESVAEAREMLEIEVGGGDGSCPERAKAWRDISENTSAPYNGRVAAFCLSDSAEVREQLVYSEKVCAQRDTLRAKIASLEAELAEAREDSARRKLDVSIETLENLKNHQRGGDYRPHVSVREINLIIGALKADRAAIDAAREAKP